MLAEPATRAAKRGHRERVQQTDAL